MVFFLILFYEKCILLMIFRDLSYYWCTLAVTSNKKALKKDNGNKVDLD